MTYDFDKMEAELRAEGFGGCDEETQEEILECLKRLREKDEEDVDSIVSDWDFEYTMTQVNFALNDRNVVTYAKDQMLPAYYEEHPEQKDADLDEAAFEAFCKEHEEDYHYHLVSGLGDNESDEASRKTTEYLSEEWDLHPEVIKKLIPRAL
jgi:hypothetical protein